MTADSDLPVDEQPDLMTVKMHSNLQTPSCATESLSLGLLSMQDPISNDYILHFYSIMFDQEDGWKNRFCLVAWMHTPREPRVIEYVIFSHSYRT